MGKLLGDLSGRESLEFTYEDLKPGRVLCFLYTDFFGRKTEYQAMAIKAGEGAVLARIDDSSPRRLFARKDGCRKWFSRSGIKMYLIKDPTFLNEIMPAPQSGFTGAHGDEIGMPGSEDTTPTGDSQPPWRDEHGDRW